MDSEGVVVVEIIEIKAKGPEMIEEGGVFWTRVLGASDSDEGVEQLTGETHATECHFGEEFWKNGVSVIKQESTFFQAKYALNGKSW